MSLIELHELQEDQGEFEGPKRDYVRKFWGRSNNKTDRATTIKQSPLLPREGDRDPFDSMAVVKRVIAQRRAKTHLIWDITVESTTQQEDVDESQHPHDREADVEWESVETNSTRYTDIKGQPIFNAARDIVPVDVEDSYWVIHVSKLLPSAPGWALSFKNVINSGLVNVDGVPFPKHTLMCKRLRFGRTESERFRGNVVRFKRCSFSLYYKPETWKVKVPNVGLVELVKAEKAQRDAKDQIRKNEDGSIQFVNGLVRVRMTNSDGTPVNDPQPLDKAGKRIDLEAQDFNPKQLIFLEKDMYKEASFSQLPLR